MSLQATTILVEFLADIYFLSHNYFCWNLHISRTTQVPKGKKLHWWLFVFILFFSILLTCYLLGSQPSQKITQKKIKGSCAKKLRQRLVRFRSLINQGTSDGEMCLCAVGITRHLLFTSPQWVVRKESWADRCSLDGTSLSSAPRLHPQPWILVSRRLQSCQHTSHPQSLPLLGTATEHRDELNWFINAWNKKSFFVCFF